MVQVKKMLKLKICPPAFLYSLQNDLKHDGSNTHERARDLNEGEGLAQHVSIQTLKEEL